MLTARDWLTGTVGTKRSARLQVVLGRYTPARDLVLPDSWYYMLSAIGRPRG